MYILTYIFSNHQSTVFIFPFIRVRCTGSYSTTNTVYVFLSSPGLFTFQPIQNQDVHLQKRAEGDGTHQPAAVRVVTNYKTFDPSITLSLYLFYWHRGKSGVADLREEAFKHSISHLIQSRTDIDTCTSQQDTQQENRGRVRFTQGTYISKA